MKAPVWRLLNTSLGDAAFSRMVVANIIPFSGHHDAGKDMWLGFPPFAQALVNRLFKLALNCLGPPGKVAGFGLPVRPPTARGRVRPSGDDGACLRLYSRSTRVKGAQVEYLGRAPASWRMAA